MMKSSKADLYDNSQALPNANAARLHRIGVVSHQWRKPPIAND
jgi:hypothetical protein